MVQLRLPTRLRWVISSSPKLTQDYAARAALALTHRCGPRFLKREQVLMLDHDSCLVGRLTATKITRLASQLGVDALHGHVANGGADGLVAARFTVEN